MAEDAQRQLDSRALEAATEARTLAQVTSQAIAEHKVYCIERDRVADADRKEAKTERHNFRAEVATTLDRMTNASEKKFDDVIASIRRLHARMNAGLIALITGLVSLVLGLLGLVGFLLVRLLHL